MITLIFNTSKIKQGSHCSSVLYVANSGFQVQPWFLFLPADVSGIGFLAPRMDLCKGGAKFDLACRKGRAYIYNYLHTHMHDLESRMILKDGLMGGWVTHTHILYIPETAGIYIYIYNYI